MSAIQHYFSTTGTYVPGTWYLLIGVGMYVPRMIPTETDGNTAYPSSHPPLHYTSFTYIQVVLMGGLLPVSAKYQYFSSRYVCATYLFIGVSLYVWYRRKPTGTRFNPLPTKKIHPTPYLFHLQDVLMGRLVTVPGSHAPGTHF